MDLQKINWKLFFKNPEAAKPDDFFRVFNTWIPDSPEIFIDVADYKHVHDGPLTVLVGHEVDYSLDDSGRRRGLLFSYKVPLNGTPEEKITSTLKKFLKACQRLVSDPAFKGGVAFDTSELIFLVNDRAMVPNTAESFRSLETSLSKAVARVTGTEGLKLSHLSNPKERFAIKITFSRQFSL